MLQFRLPMRRANLAFLWDHRVQGAAILPGAAYCEMSIAAAHTLARIASPPAALTGAAIAAPLALPEPTSSVLLTVELGLITSEVSIRSAAAGKVPGRADSGTLHLRGSISTAIQCQAPAAPAALESVGSVERCRARSTDPQAVAMVYQQLAAAGLQYGKSFRRAAGLALC